MPRPYKQNFFGNYVNPVLTGTEHGGPFNEVAPERPTDSLENALYWDHDKGYGRIGDEAYTKWSKYDQDLLDKVPWWKPRNWLALSYYGLKKGARFANLIGDAKMPTQMEQHRRRRQWQRRVEQLDAKFREIQKRRGKPLFKRNIGATNAARYHASKLTGKRVSRHYLFKTPKDFTPRDLINIMYPTIKWEMIGQGLSVHDSAVGRQLVTDGDGISHTWSVMFSRANLQKIYQKIFTDAAFNPQERNNDDAGTSDNRNNTVPGGLFDLVDVSQLPSLRCYGYKRELTFTNPLNTVAYIELWEIVVKDDLTDSFRTDWVHALDKDTGNDNFVGNYGLNALSRNTADPKVDATYSYTDPGFRPWKRLKALWNNHKVLKKTRYKLEPSSSVQHVVYVPGFTISQNRLFSEHQDKTRIKDLTIEILMFTIGEKCYDDTAGHQFNSYMPSKITVAHRDKMIVKMRPLGRKMFRFTTNDAPNFAAGSFDPAGAWHPQAAIPRLAIPGYAAPEIDVANVQLS